jgi:CelD/BcsL family acetyltransferase involved in cellulose biosynthesis
VRVTVVSPDELGDAERAAWALLQDQVPSSANPCLSSTFAGIVGRHRPDARVAIVEEAGRTVAFLPFEAGARGIATPIGIGLSGAEGFVGAHAAIDAREVVRAAGLRGWRFRHVSVEQSVLTPHAYAGALEQVNTIDLTNGYDAYVAALSKSETRALARRRRGLERDVGPVRLVWRSTDTRHLETLLDWKSEQFDSARRLFSDGGSRRILYDLLETDEADCAGLLSLLVAGDRIAAIQLAVAGPRGLSWFTTGYSHELARYSPGTLMARCIAEEAPRRGVTFIDMGWGDVASKRSLSNSSYLTCGGAVWANRLESAARSLYRRTVLRGRPDASGDEQIVAASVGIA